jgi:hypothetical protein
MMIPPDINFISHIERESTTTLMDRLKKDKDLHSPRSFDIIETLFRSLITNNGIETDESKFDFIMDDGIEQLTRAISDQHCSCLHIDQGFQILLAIAEDSCWHWQSIFDGIGGILGIMNLLEKHHLKESIFNDILFTMIRLMEYNVHHFQASQIVQWLSYFDLILEGVQENIDKPKVFHNFCRFLEIHNKGRAPPQETHQRIFCILCRGLEIHQLGQSLVTRFFVLDETNTIPRIVFRYSTIQSTTMQHMTMTTMGTLSPTSAKYLENNPFGGHSGRCAAAA